MDYKEPLFWIHLNMDYPFNLKGILYFPRINTEYESIEGTIKLYNNQVFIADNIKEVIPEYLMLLKGVIDCPDFPLNVSRSALQNDGFVKKISDYISKKVADKLSGMCKTERETYEKYWDDISPFLKYGCIKRPEIQRADDGLHLYKDINRQIPDPEGTVPEKTEEQPEDTQEKVDFDESQDVPEETSKPAIRRKTKKREKKQTTVYYVTDEIQQSQYINMFKDAGLNAVILRHNIDTAFITHVERQREDVKFQRIDADVTDTFKEETSGEDLKETTDALTEVFHKALNNDKLQVKVEKLKNETYPL